VRTFAVFSSGGNDSIALLQLLHEARTYSWPRNSARIIAVYSDTGWAAPYWAERIAKLEAWCAERDIEHVTITSKGFEDLVRGEGNRLGEAPGRFPTGKQKFCTRQLKILPAQEWLKAADPAGEFICVVGVRRAESERRKDTPVIVPFSEHHGWRQLWHPLAETDDADRDALLERAGWEPLPHRSDECEPCIFSARADLRRVGPEKVDLLRQMETDTGKTMFRPRAYAGAVGIDEVMRWAHSERGQFKPREVSPEEMFQDGGLADGGEEPEGGCESDWCGI
jgi:hypothetical protein